MVLVPQLCGGLGIFMYTAVLVHTPGVMISYEGGESNSTNSTLGCTRILFADTMKHNFQRVDD